MPRPIQELIQKYARDPVQVRIEQKAMTVPTVEQVYYEVDRRFKVELLTRLIDLHDFKIGIIFCNTKRMVDDLEALRRSLNAEKIDLLGHSWGGILSMAYAVRYPDRVRHLILVGSGDAKPAANEYLFDKLYPA